MQKIPQSWSWIRHSKIAIFIMHCERKKDIGLNRTLFTDIILYQRS